MSEHCAQQMRGSRQNSGADFNNLQALAETGGCRTRWLVTLTLCRTETRAEAHNRRKQVSAVCHSLTDGPAGLLRRRLEGALNELQL